MLQRDYIMRLIREFMAAIERMLEKKELTSRREEIRQLYDQYVGPYALYHNATLDEVMTAIAGMQPEQRLPRMEMLATLYYHEADTVSKPEADVLLDKAFALYTYIEQHGREYSVRRRQRMAELGRRLGGRQA